MNMLAALVGCTLVYFNEDTDVSIWWNGDATFNVYAGEREVNVFTHYGIESTWNAMNIAAEWIEVEGEEE